MKTNQARRAMARRACRSDRPLDSRRSSARQSSPHCDHDHHRGPGMIRSFVYGFAALALGLLSAGATVSLAQSADPGPRPINQNPNTPPAIAGASPTDLALFNQAMVSPSPSQRGAFDLGFSVSGTFVSSSN